MDEFGMGSATINSAYGITANPWGKGKIAIANECNLQLTIAIIILWLISLSAYIYWTEEEGVVSPGGSSGGGAVAVAAGLSHGEGVKSIVCLWLCFVYLYLSVSLIQNTYYIHLLTHMLPLFIFKYIFIKSQAPLAPTRVDPFVSPPPFVAV